MYLHATEAHEKQRRPHATAPAVVGTKCDAVVQCKWLHLGPLPFIIALLNNRCQRTHQVEEPYFWEEGGDPNVDWWAKVRQSFHFGGVKALAGAESIGEVSSRR